MENLLISACLLGFECKYSGGSNKLSDERIAALKKEYRLIPVCPETAGGLPVPRDPSERLGDKVVSSKGKDVTAEFTKGAETALYLAKRYGCRKALLKRNSPSCGGEFIYDGSFSGKIIPGQGVTAELLRLEGIEIFGE
ncbi:MAG: DUF523 domain-containing protein [Oscillospiraceae bacterium]|nr:DUF523 domain-containing protein [Oscillospiraceae bacterium]